MFTAFKEPEEHSLFEMDRAETVARVLEEYAQHGLGTEKGLNEPGDSWLLSEMKPLLEMNEKGLTKLLLVDLSIGRAFTARVGQRRGLSKQL